MVCSALANDNQLFTLILFERLNSKLQRRLARRDISYNQNMRSDKFGKEYPEKYQRNPAMRLSASSDTNRTKEIETYRPSVRGRDKNTCSKCTAVSVQKIVVATAASAVRKPEPELAPNAACPAHPSNGTRVCAYSCST